MHYVLLLDLPPLSLRALNQSDFVIGLQELSYAKHLGLDDLRYVGVEE